MNLGTTGQVHCVERFAGSKASRFVTFIYEEIRKNAEDEKAKKERSERCGENGRE